MSSQSPAAWLIMLSVVVHLGCNGEAEKRTAATPIVGDAGINKTRTDREAMEFHECVRLGSLEEVRKAIVSNRADVNLRGPNGETPLMMAIAAKDVQKIKLLVEHGADPEITDDFNRTALSHAVDMDFAEGVSFLLDLGVDRGYLPKYPLKKVQYDFDLLATPLPDGFKGVISEEEWKELLQEQQDYMEEMGQNPTVEPTIASVQSVEVLKLFLAAGDDVRLAPSEVKRAYVGLGTGGEFQSSAKDYHTYRSPRFGTANPEPMDNPFWSDMVRLGGNAYSARAHFNDDDSWESAVWSFDRFGSSLTPLPDGRMVQVGGEHEDYYDPDFYIYNDVVVYDGNGGFKILGYPREVFPPTDSHTSTFVDGSIYLIGCLGYPQQREVGRTPVFRLAIDSWKIEAVPTSGEMPSWLHRHRAVYDAESNAIEVEGGSLLVPGEDGEPQFAPNNQRYELDLETFIWRKLH